MPLPQKKMTLTTRPGEETLVSPDKFGDKRKRFLIVKIKAIPKKAIAV